MRRPHVLPLFAAVGLVALITVGCWYRGYLAGVLPSAAAEGGDISLPPGFRIAVYAADVPNARQMAAGPAGVVFVGSRSEGKVYAVVDRDGDHRADQVHVLAQGLNQPSGLAADTGLPLGPVLRGSARCRPHCGDAWTCSSRTRRTSPPTPSP